ncbi:MAG TPA: sugar ABC transporter substrate-binding protein [Roseiflexaceae bacterium]|nr:sugar ABC transporter substrate-binding protein [Roseiflexaceae bacterium]
MDTDQRRTLSRRELLRLAAGAASATTIGSLLAACGGAQSPAAGGTTAPGQPGGHASISMLGWGSVLEKENVDRALKVFEGQNTGIKVAWLHTPNTDYPTKLKTMLAGGTPPDVFWANNMLDYVARKVALDITERVKQDAVIGTANYFLEPQESERTTWNGQWYGIGSCWVAPHLYYNVEMLEKAGVTPPSSSAANAWTWDEFLEYARRLTLDASGKHPGDPGFDLNNVTQWGISWPTWSLLRDVLVFSNGGDAFTKEHTVKLGEPAAVEAIQALADLAVKHHVAPQAAATEQLGMNSQQMLASGKLAMLADGSWALQDIAKLGFKYGCGVLPKLKIATTTGTAHMHMIHKDTKNQEAAWKLLSFLSSDEYQRGLCKVGLWLPSHSSLLSKEGLATWITPGVHPEGYEQIATEYLAKHTRSYYQPAGFEEANQIIASALDPVWIGQQSAAEALTSDVIRQADEVLQKAVQNLA